VKVLNLAGIVVPALYGFQGAEAERDGSCGSLGMDPAAAC
jgi:hypothetical protein